MSPIRPAALIVGAGPGIGSAFVRRFVRSGWLVGGARRTAFDEDLSALDGFIPYEGVDARKTSDVDALFSDFTSVCSSEGASHDLTVFNVGANIRYSIGDTTERKFEKCWEMGCKAGFLVGQAAARSYLGKSAPSGTMIFTGASASLRGSANFSAFAVAKGGLRQLAQSMARELSPSNVHVAHVVVDGAVDTPWVRENFGGRIAEAPEGALVEPDEVAKAYEYLHGQGRTAWTFEMDMRPYCERW
mmetsp:Transcript_26646/g.53134  ORF Transcript_26646/g.53134 Transcript_26646/m.53134 type:complete len:245 (-) Transcript_26646:2218-2952(-)